MMITHTNNRLVPAIVIAVCFIVFYCLIDPAVENYGIKQVPAKNVAEHKSNGNGNGNQERPTEEAHAYIPPDNLSTDDILLVVKTGGTSIWKRLLIHLTTSLSPSRVPMSSTVIYSDMPDKIGPFTVIDCLANMSSKAMSKPDFEVYLQQPEYAKHNYYLEATSLDGDEAGPPGGWIIDKYKFIPMMQHAGEHWPEAKWYVYMEDDAYLFLPNVLAYLARFDWRQPHYLGSYAAKSDVIFAHGGAGFVLSRGAWEQSFGRNANMADDYYEYTADHCCGDQVLGLALRDYGVKFGEKNGDGGFTWGFNPVVHWAFAFSRYNWCSPLLSWHKVHGGDVARYYELEKSWDFGKGPLLHRDFFAKMMLPSMQKRARWWDNLSSMYEVTSGNKDARPAPADEEYDPALWNKAWESVDACEAACKGWAECMQWNFVDDLCKMDGKMVMGRGYAPGMWQRKTGMMQTSGWLPERLSKWTC